MRTFLKTTAAACILMGCANLAIAQDNAPRTLSPRTLGIPTQQADPVATPIPVKTISGGINVQSLGSVDKEALGVLSGSNAFAPDMWSGSNRAWVEALLERLPARPSTPYLRILQRRLLLSAATPPQGKSGTQSLSVIRASKLAAMGQTKDVLSLIKSAPQDEHSADLNRLETEALLLEDEITKACSVAAGNFQSDASPFWVKTMAFCRMLAKQSDQAMLSLSLLRENGDNDPVFYSLMDALSNGERAKIDELPSPSALELALVKADQAILSENARNTDDPNFLNLLTKAGDFAATQRAVELNLASADFLAKAFLSAKFSKQELENPIATAENLDPVKAQALLYQVSTQENQLAVIQSETMAMAFDLARQNGNFFSIARLYRPVLEKMPRSIDMLWFAPNAVRAMLAAGDWENAKSWYLVLRNAAFTDPEAAKHWTAVRPLASLAGFDVAAEAVTQALIAWWQTQPEDAARFNSAMRLYSVLDGLGLNVPDQLWLDLMAGPRTSDTISPKAGIRIKMNDAAANARLGETVLLFLLGTNGDPIAKIDPSFLRDGLNALRQVGLERDARAVAVEIMLQAGF